MGFTTPNLPKVDPESFLAQPLMERVKTLVLKWVDYGYGVPRMVHLIYLVKLVVFYCVLGVTLATATSGLPAFWHVAQWWDQPIVYQKLILWTVLLELLGLAGSWGPLAGKTKPMTGGFRFWARPNTIRLRPWRRVPFTAGDRRTRPDIALYVALALALMAALVLPGVVSGSLSAALPDNTSGLVSPAVLIGPIVLLILIGLRDKTIFLAARGEQYLPALVFFATLPFVDMIIACKLLIFACGCGPALQVRPALLPRHPADGQQQPERCRSSGSSGRTTATIPHDLRPSHLATFMAHGPGTVVEIVSPLILLLSPGPWLTLLAVAVMVCFHLFIISTFPLAVPLEWNALFAYTVRVPVHRASPTGTATRSGTCPRPG